MIYPSCRSCSIHIQPLEEGLSQPTLEVFWIVVLIVAG